MPRHIPKIQADVEPLIFDDRANNASSWVKATRLLALVKARRDARLKDEQENDTFQNDERPTNDK